MDNHTGDTSLASMHCAAQARLKDRVDRLECSSDDEKRRSHLHLGVVLVPLLHCSQRDPPLFGTPQLWQPRLHAAVPSRRHTQ